MSSAINSQGQAGAAGRPATPSTTTNPQRPQPAPDMSRFESDFRRIFGAPTK